MLCGAKMEQEKSGFAIIQQYIADNIRQVTLAAVIVNISREHCRRRRLFDEPKDIRLMSMLRTPNDVTPIR